MNTQPIYLALYRGRRDGSGWRVWCARATDWLTRKLTRGQYSHCELAVDIGGGQFDCYSASIRDGGVRCKQMRLPESKWDLLPLPPRASLSAALKLTWLQTAGKAYDWPGALGFVLFTRHNPDKWFCSEWCAQVLGLPESWRFTPNNLSAVVRGWEANHIKDKFADSLINPPPSDKDVPL